MLSSGEREFKGIATMLRKTALLTFVSLIAISGAMAEEDTFFYRHFNGSAGSGFTPGGGDGATPPDGGVQNPGVPQESAVAGPESVTGLVGGALSANFAVTGLTAPITWSWTGDLQPSFTFTPAGETLALQASPTAAGTGSFTVTATGSDLTSRALTVPWTVAQPILGFSPHSFRDGRTDSLTATYTEGAQPPIAWVIAPSPPSWIQLQQSLTQERSVQIVITPPAGVPNGSYTVTGQDGNGVFASANLSVNPVDGPTMAAIPDVVMREGFPISRALTGGNVQATATWSVTGPSWLGVTGTGASASLSGTAPATMGNTAIAVTLTDADGAVVQRSATMRALGPLAMASQPSSFTVGQGQGQSVSLAIDAATEPRAPVAWTLLDGNGTAQGAGGSQVPTWLSLTGTIGATIAATPPGSVVAGSYGPFSARAVDADGMAVVSNDFSVSVLVPESNAYAWGANANGQVGNNTTTAQFSPVRVSNGVTFTQVTRGGNHACGLDATGKAWCWGSGSSGRLGVGDLVNRLEPTAVNTTLTFKQITAGSAHTCAIDMEDRAWCWGVGSNGVLGNGATQNQTLPVEVQTTTRFSAISGGNLTSCGLDLNGYGWCWGSGVNGILGNANTIGSLVPVQVEAETSSDPKLVFSSISVGDQHACAISDLQAYCWGTNTERRLAIVGTGHVSRPTKSFGTRQIRDISAGGSTCAVTRDGETFCAGASGSGQAGATSTTTTVNLLPRNDWVAVHTISNRTCGLTSSGDGYCWGANTDGALGTGLSTPATTHIPQLMAHPKNGSITQLFSGLTLSN